MANTNNEKRGLAARILGGQPTPVQKVVFWLMVISLLIWPLGFFISMFFFDAPIRSSTQKGRFFLCTFLGGLWIIAYFCIII